MIKKHTCSLITISQQFSVGLCVLECGSVSAAKCGTATRIYDMFSICSILVNDHAVLRDAALKILLVLKLNRCREERESSISELLLWIQNYLCSRNRKWGGSASSRIASCDLTFRSLQTVHVFWSLTVNFQLLAYFKISLLRPHPPQK